MAIVPLPQIQTLEAYESNEVNENIRISIGRPFPRLHALPEFGKHKGDKPIALAAGGPSIKKHVDELREFDCVMVAGTAHDWVMEQGISPRYAVTVDAHPTVTAMYIKKPNPLTTYLVATQCNETVFKALDGQAIAMWHCLSESNKEFMDALEPGWQGLGGGCTVGLRAIGMAMVLGYRNIHLFGYDSCIASETETHAYPLQEPAIENEGLGFISSIRVGISGPGEKSYICHGYQIAQAQNFELFLGMHHKLIDLTFHGEGLLRDIHEMMMAKLAAAEEVDAA